MRKSTYNGAKLVVTAVIDKTTGKIRTESVFDRRNDEYWTPEHIGSRGIWDFSDLHDFEDTLNWNLNGDGSKFGRRFGQSGKDTSVVYGYVVA